MLEYLEGMCDDWRTVVRPALLSFAVRTDSARAKNAARELSKEIPRGINASCLVVDDTLLKIRNPEARVHSGLDNFKRAEAKHLSLVALAEELEAALRSQED